MGYTSQKIGTVIGAIFIWIVSSILLLCLVGGKDMIYVLPIILLISPALLIRSVIGSWREFAKYERQNYGWYIQTYPSCFRQNRVHCYSCKSGKVHTRNLFNRTYTREHFCAQCGTTLYFSRES